MQLCNLFCNLFATLRNWLRRLCKTNLQVKVNQTVWHRSAFVNSVEKSEVLKQYNTVQKTALIVIGLKYCNCLETFQNCYKVIKTINNHMFCIICGLLVVFEQVCAYLRLNVKSD